MKGIKVFNLILIISLIIILLTTAITTSYATTGIKDMLNELEENSNKKVYASSNEVSPNTEFYLIFNMSKIEYDDFKVKITNASNAVASEIPVEAENISVTNKEISFNVNKESISLNKIGVAYTSPEKEGTLEFNIEITNLEDSISKWQNEISAIDNNLVELKSTLSGLKLDLENASQFTGITSGIGNSTENKVENNEVSNTNGVDLAEIENEIARLEDLIESNNAKKQELEGKIVSYTTEKIEEVVIVDVVKENSRNEIMEDELKEKMEQEFKDREMSQMKKMMQEVESLEGNLQKAREQISELSSSNTYKGSQNNYLSTLNITGVTLNTEFKKTNLTYFANVDSSVINLNVNAIAEEDSSIVTIYGNTDLQVGKNKIIVNVTAEDGSVKTYKIYVEKK